VHLYKNLLTRPSRWDARRKTKIVLRTQIFSHSPAGKKKKSRSLVWFSLRVKNKLLRILQFATQRNATQRWVCFLFGNGTPNESCNLEEARERFGHISDLYTGEWCCCYQLEIVESDCLSDAIPRLWELVDFTGTSYIQCDTGFSFFLFFFFSFFVRRTGSSDR